MHNVRRRPRNIRNNDRSTNRSGDTTTMNLIVETTSSSTLGSNRPLKVVQQHHALESSDNNVHVKLGSPETSSLVLPSPSSVSHPSKMMLPPCEAEDEDVHVLHNNINKHKMEIIRKMMTAATTNVSQPKSTKAPVPVVEGSSDYSDDDDDDDEHDDYTVTVRRSECLLQDEPSLVATNNRLSDDDEDNDDDEYEYEDDGLSSVAWNYDYVYNYVDDDDDEESFSSMCMNGSTSSRDIMDKEEDEMQTNITIVSRRRLRLGQRRRSSSSPRTKRRQEMDDSDAPVRVTRSRRSIKRFSSSSTSLVLGSSSTSCGDILSSRIKQSCFGRSRFGRAIATKYSSTRDINNSVIQENEADAGFVSVLPARSLSFKMEQVPEGNEEEEDDDDVVSEHEVTTQEQKQKRTSLSNNADSCCTRGSLSDDNEEDETKSTEEEKQEEMQRKTVSHSSRLSSPRRFSPVPNSIYAKLCAGEGVHIRLVPENTRFAKLMAGESDIPIVPMRMKHSRFAKTRAGRVLLTPKRSTMEPTTNSSSNNVEDGATIETTGTGSYYAVPHSS